MNKGDACAMRDEVIILIEGILNVPHGVVTGNTEIGELPEWDSLHNVQIIAELEKNFGINITPEMVIDLETVADIADLMEELTE